MTYLHYVLALWAHQWRRRHAQGAVIITRYADDAVVGFQYRHDAKQFLTALQERLATFALHLQPGPRAPRDLYLSGIHAHL